MNAILKRQKKEAFIDKLEEVLIKLSPPKIYGSAAFEKKQHVGKELYKRQLKRLML